MFTTKNILIKTNQASKNIKDLFLSNNVDVIEVSRLYPESLWCEVILKNEVSAGDAYELAHQLEQVDGITAVDPLVISDIDVDDTSEHADDELAMSAAAGVIDYEWHLKHTKVRAAWANTASKGSGIKIGHLDTGYTEHPENLLSGRIRTDLGYNFVEKKQDAIEPLKTIKSGHGGATSSVIISPEGRQPGFGGADANAYTVGIAADSELIPVRVDKNVFWLLAKAEDVKGIHHAMQENCDIISMSRGGFGYDALFEEVEKAFYEGIIVVAAAGNRVGTVVYPARYKYTVAVSGSTIEKKPWSGASKGKTVDISAPAHEVYRARTRKKTGNYFFDVAESSGTSYATPIVASAAALWLSHHGGRQNLIQTLGGVKHAVPLVFKYLLETEAFSPGVNWNPDKYGPGIIDIEALIKASLPRQGIVDDLVEGFSTLELSQLKPDHDETNKIIYQELIEGRQIDNKKKRLLLNEFNLNYEFNPNFKNELSNFINSESASVNANQFEEDTKQNISSSLRKIFE